MILAPAQDEAAADPGGWPGHRSPYDEFAARAHNGRAGVPTLRVIDECPADTAMFADYFLSLPVNKLAGCWVACMVDAAVLGDFSPGDVARALNVVASRLHGVTLDIIGEPIVITAPTPPSEKARPLGSVPPVPSAPPSTLETQMKQKLPAPVPVSAGKYKINVGAPPEPSSGKGTRRTEAFVTACDLPPGGWFVYEDAPKTLNCSTKSKAWSQSAGFALVLYRTAAGKVVVKRPAEGQPAHSLSQGKN
jgi:hypothetical protein